MKWKNMKTLAIVFLLIFNAIIGYLIVSDYSRKNYYDSKTIEEITTLLAESNIYLNNNILSQKITSLPVLRGVASTDDYENALFIISGVRSIEADGTLVCTAAGGIFTVNRDRLILYKAYGNETLPEGYLTSVSDYAVGAGKAVSVLTDFLRLEDLLEAGNSNTGYSVVCEQIQYSPNGKYFDSSLCLYYNGIPTDCIFSMQFSDTEVLRFEGTLPIATPDETLRADTVGLLSFLLSERAYFNTSSDMAAGIHEIESVSYRYSLHFDLNGQYYLTPVCVISYKDGFSSSYDCMTGERQ